MMRSLRLTYVARTTQMLASAFWTSSFVLLAGLVGACSTAGSIGTVVGERSGPETPEGAAGTGGQDPGSMAPDAGQDQPRADGGGVQPSTLKLPDRPAQEIKRIRDGVQEALKLDGSSLAVKYPVSFAPASKLEGTPVGLDRVQGSPLALDGQELAKLNELGFVISEHHSYPTYTYGYREIYAEHLPLYVSVDSILEAVHRSYDDILVQVETGVLVERLTTLLDRARGALPSVQSEQVRGDLDVFFTVTLGLLTGSEVSPVAGGDATLVKGLLAAANAANGPKGVPLFGVDRTEDFAQYKPRGHYEFDPLLQRYFRAMMWLGRIDFRFLETRPDGSQELRRRQVEAALTMRELLDEPALQAYKTIDGVVRAFVGEPDYMALEELDRLRADLGISSVSGLAAISDETLVSTLSNVGYGRQRILSTIIANDGTMATLPLSLSFALLGQRYVLDSHVFSNVVYDRVANKGLPLRLMPNPLDAAFAAFGNNEAGRLLATDLQKYGYAPELGAVRVLADSHDQSFWDGNLYDLWLSAIRSLSSSGDVAAGKQSGLPTVMTTEPWARRLLNAQLASWAELRHDTILYAKQSYTAGVMCEFPDAFVDPYPRFYAAMEAFAARGTEVASLLGTAPFVPQIKEYFATLASTSAMLRQMADAELAGSQFTNEQRAFIDQAVTVAKVTSGCTTEDKPDGWYPRLHFLQPKAVEFAPTIADVHTQPDDESGNRVGHVLHVGTGRPRIMVAALDRCGTPSAYVGLVSSYFERTTKDFKRLTDSEWSKEFGTSTPEDVAWMRDLIVR